MRLIDADATFELFRRCGSRDYRREKGTIMDAMKMISHPEYTPTVDAVPVVHGRWNIDDYDSGDPGYYSAFIEVHCSECGYELGAESGQYGWCYGDPFPLNYCPNCGAKMDLDQ